MDGREGTAQTEDERKTRPSEQIRSLGLSATRINQIYQEAKTKDVMAFRGKRCLPLEDGREGNREGRVPEKRAQMAGPQGRVYEDETSWSTGEKGTCR